MIIPFRHNLRPNMCPYCRKPLKFGEGIAWGGVLPSYISPKINRVAHSQTICIDCSVIYADFQRRENLLRDFKNRFFLLCLCKGLRPLALKCPDTDGIFFPVSADRVEFMREESDKIIRFYIKAIDNISDLPPGASLEAAAEVFDKTWQAMEAVQ